MEFCFSLIREKFVYRYPKREQRKEREGNEGESEGRRRKQKKWRTDIPSTVLPDISKFPAVFNRSQLRPRLCGTHKKAIRFSAFLSGRISGVISVVLKNSFGIQKYLVSVFFRDAFFWRPAKCIYRSAVYFRYRCILHKNNCTCLRGSRNKIMLKTVHSRDAEITCTNFLFRCYIKH